MRPMDHPVNPTQLYNRNIIVRRFEFQFLLFCLHNCLTISIVLNDLVKVSRKSFKLFLQKLFSQTQINTLIFYCIVLFPLWLPS